MPQFDVDTFIPQLFWMGVLFALFYMVSKKAILPHMQKIFSDRQKKIEDLLKEAEQLAVENEALKNELFENRRAFHEKAEAEVDVMRKEQFQYYQEQQEGFLRDLSELLHHQEADIKSHEEKLLGAMSAEQKPLIDKAHAVLAETWEGRA